MSTRENNESNTASTTASIDKDKFKRKNVAGNRSDPSWEHGIDIDSKKKLV